MNCESPAKRQEFFLHSGRLLHGQETSVDAESRELALAMEEEEAAACPHYVSLAEHLSLALSAELLNSVQMSEEAPNSSCNSVPLYTSTLAIFDRTAFCIGRFSVSLANGADLKALMSRVACSGMGIDVSVSLLVSCWGSRCYIELRYNKDDALYLPVITTNPLHKSALSRRQNTKFSGWYRVQLVMCGIGSEEKGEEGEGEMRDAETQTRGTGQEKCAPGNMGGGDNGAEVEAVTREQGTSTCESGGGDNGAEVEAVTREQGTSTCESGGGDNGAEVEAVTREQGTSTCESGGGDNGAEVEAVTREQGTSTCESGGGDNGAEVEAVTREQGTSTCESGGGEWRRTEQVGAVEMQAVEEIEIVRVENGAWGGVGRGGHGTGTIEGAAQDEGGQEMEQSAEDGAGGGEGVSVTGGGCVEVEVWVGGVMCEAGEPSALPSGGNSVNLVDIVRLFHPHISVETQNGGFYSRRC